MAVEHPPIIRKKVDLEWRIIDTGWRILEENYNFAKPSRLATSPEAHRGIYVSSVKDKKSAKY